MVKGMGGAMDLVAGVKKIIVVMEHTAKDGSAKFIAACTLPLTGKGVVDLVVTDLAVVEVTPEGFLLREVAPGWTPEQVRERTEAELRISPELREMPVEVLSGRLG
jgi:3-oxoacid CoA-transferase subunit B